MVGRSYWKGFAAEVSLPPLFKAYLKAGAKVAIEPALDSDFRCIDFFTVLETRELTERYGKKFNGC